MSKILFLYLRVRIQLRDVVVIYQDRLEKFLLMEERLGEVGRYLIQIFKEGWVVIGKLGKDRLGEGFLQVRFQREGWVSCIVVEIQGEDRRDVNMGIVEGGQEQVFGRLDFGFLGVLEQGSDVFGQRWRKRNMFMVGGEDWQVIVGDIVCAF